MKYLTSFKIALPALLLGLALGYLIFQYGAAPISKSEGGEQVHEHAQDGEATIWTCSMHPQIRQPEPGQCPICGMDLIPLEEDSGADNPLQLTMTKEAVQLANIETSTVGVINGVKKEIVLNGKVAADERRTWSQTAHIPGRIEKLYVSFTGEKVYKGQKIAEIYSPNVITAQQELLEAVKYVDINPAMIESAKGKLRNWKIPEKDIEDIINMGKLREVFPLYADATGVITDRMVDVGDHVMEGAPLFKINNLSRLWILFDAYEEDLQYVHLGDEIAFEVAALPGRTFHTKISFVDPVINPKTRVAALRGEISNRDGALKPAMFVRGTIRAISTSSNQIQLPKTAVLWTGKRSVVWVKVKDMDIPTFEYREVVLGPSTGDQYVIQQGLQSGDEVVTYGAFAIDASAQLNNRQSMMNQLVHLDDNKKTSANSDSGMKCGAGKCGGGMKDEMKK